MGRVRWARLLVVGLVATVAIQARELAAARAALEAHAAATVDGPLTLDILTVDDLVLVPPLSSGCTFSPSPEVEQAGLALDAEQAAAVLEAMTEEDAGELEVHRGQLIVLRSAAGQARVRAALAALRRAAGSR